VQKLSFSDLARLETGRLVTRLTNDVDQVQEAAAMLLRILVRAPLLVVGSLIMAVITSPRLSLLIFALSPLLIATFVISRGPRAEALQRRAGPPRPRECHDAREPRRGARDQGLRALGP
jgi:ABC-type multidrug transport system fused ATPase/permease subunit